MERQTSQTFHLTWLTSAPLLRGNWVALGLSLIPIALAIFTLFIALGLSEPARGVSLCSGALFLSLGAILIQVPAYLGRVELNAETLIVAGRLSGKRGRLHIPRDSIRQAYFVPLRRPPGWLPTVWGIVELICTAGALSAGWGSGGGHWYWLTALAVGLSFWPLMAARWRTQMQVALVYERPGAKQPGLIRAWATPHQAGSLVNALRGKIDWEERDARGERGEAESEG